MNGLIRFFSDAFTWYTFGAVVMSFLAVNAAILNVYVAHRLCQIIDHRTTVAGYVSALTLLSIAVILTGEYVLDWLDAPRWWWQATFGTYLMASFVFVHGFYVKLILPVTAITNQIQKDAVCIRNEAEAREE